MKTTSLYFFEFLKIGNFVLQWLKKFISSESRSIFKDKLTTEVVRITLLLCLIYSVDCYFHFNETVYKNGELKVISTSAASSIIGIQTCLWTDSTNLLLKTDLQTICDQIIWTQISSLTDFPSWQSCSADRVL